MEGVMADAEEILATPMNLLEAGLILVLRDSRTTAENYESWLRAQGIQVSQAVDHKAVLNVYMRYGKGIHRAGLNVGDCFAYALAEIFDAPLLYKGDDFSRTDIRSALQPT